MKPRKIQMSKRTLLNDKWTIVTIAIGILLIGFTIGLNINRHKDTSSKPVTDRYVFAMETMDVAKLFSCSCGSCEEKNLAVCTCPTAISTKNFIENNLKKGERKADIVELVKDRYGYFKG